MRRMALTAAVAALLLTGCGGGASSTQSSSGEAAAPMPAREAQVQAYDQAAEGGQESAKVPDRGKSITTDVKVTQQDRQIIYVSTMTVRAKDVPAAADKAKALVSAAGGYLSKEESSSAEGSEADATLEFKIPPARYQEVLTALGRDLGKRLSMTQGTQDVTMQVADVNSRLKSAEGALASLRTLLSKAKTIGQVLQVEREISGREAELESLQAQQKELAAQVSMATLTLKVIGPVAVVTEPDDEPAGFLGGLKSGWSALLSFLKVMLTALGVLLPWLLIILPIAAVVLFLVRRSRATQRKPVIPAEPEQTG